MSEDRLQVGIVAVKRKLKGPWAEFAWLPSAVLPAVPAAAPGTRLSVDADEEAYYVGPCEVLLHPGETGHYRDNLASGRPALWVALRPKGADAVEVVAVTADPYEGEAMAGDMGEIVEAVPMPAEIVAEVAAFFAAFHVERAFFKRRRDRAGTEAPGPRQPDVRGSRDESQ